MAGSALILISNKGFIDCIGIALMPKRVDTHSFFMSQQIFSDFTVKDHQGQAVSLKSYQNCVILAVNTASACGFTPQYAELQALHERYHARGLRVIAFPCNQFLKQESGSNEEIQTFCRRFSVTFPVMDKIEVNGAHADPLWQWMKARAQEF